MVTMTDDSQTVSTQDSTYKPMESQDQEDDDTDVERFVLVLFIVFNYKEKRMINFVSFVNLTACWFDKKLNDINC